MKKSQVWGLRQDSNLRAPHRRTDAFRANQGPRQYPLWDNTLNSTMKIFNGLALYFIRAKRVCQSLSRATVTLLHLPSPVRVSVRVLG